MALGRSLPSGQYWVSRNQVTNPENCTQHREINEPLNSFSSDERTSKPLARGRTYPYQGCRPRPSVPIPAIQGQQTRLGSGDGDLENALLCWIDQNLGLVDCNRSRSTPNALMQRCGECCY